MDRDSQGYHYNVKPDITEEAEKFFRNKIKENLIKKKQIKQNFLFQRSAKSRAR